MEITTLFSFMILSIFGVILFVSGYFFRYILETDWLENKIKETKSKFIKPPENSGPVKIMTSQEIENTDSEEIKRQKELLE